MVDGYKIGFLEGHLTSVSMGSFTMVTPRNLGFTIRRVWKLTAIDMNAKRTW